MNKQTMFVQRREAGITTSEQVDYYLAADVEARIARLESALENLLDDLPMESQGWSSVKTARKALEV